MLGKHKDGDDCFSQYNTFVCGKAFNMIVSIEYMGKTPFSILLPT